MLALVCYMVKQATEVLFSCKKSPPNQLIFNGMIVTKAYEQEI